MLGASYGMGPAVRWAATREATAHRRYWDRDQDRVKQQPVPAN